MTAPAISRWLEFIERGELDVLDSLIADDAVFYSPAVFTPQQGKKLVAKYLLAAERMFHGTDFHYVGQWKTERSAVLEFAVNIDGVHVEGIDIIAWNTHDQITSVKVMVRPLQGLQHVVTKMGELLAGGTH
ncbi:MAG: nuclear transport factor 2 family protein [Actinomycetota bacterium]|uniref:Nuclear transport factor 2 family protein n=1 Tax=Mycobacterium lentiflavum TaxID=141349 RepID=A0ABY3UNS4_MYCLN|nr:nuclear transport factor 2 family protein [Mycobacterium lentiflavum]MEE3062452.1 nuclear transport factor 2 family protein [Actinomycetota bacterium]ULP40326.1 nuclear transport factor 2 family protein [Mycobacterium lentiflavum]